MVGASCGKDAGETQLCTCDYLTDTDLPGKQAVVVCGASPEASRDIAAACVRDLGVGHVEVCSCERGGEPCRAGLCTQR